LNEARGRSESNWQAVALRHFGARCDFEHLDASAAAEAQQHSR
jgi:hypothetical protein